MRPWGPLGWAPQHGPVSGPFLAGRQAWVALIILSRWRDGLGAARGSSMAAWHLQDVTWTGTAQTQGLLPMACQPRAFLRQVPAPLAHRQGEASSFHSDPTLSSSPQALSRGCRLAHPPRHPSYSSWPVESGALKDKSTSQLPELVQETSFSRKVLADVINSLDYLRGP